MTTKIVDISDYLVFHFGYFPISEFIYNRIGNTAESFHYRVLSRGCLKIFDKDPVLWLAFNIELRGTDAAALAVEISRQMRRFVDEGTEADLVVRSDRDKRFLAIMIPRHNSIKRPGGIFANPGDFGLFGAAEMAGYLLCVRSEEAFTKIVSADGGKHYEQALRELSYKPYAAKSLEKTG